MISETEMMEKFNPARSRPLSNSTKPKLNWPWENQPNEQFSAHNTQGLCVFLLPTLRRSWECSLSDPLQLERFPFLMILKGRNIWSFRMKLPRLQSSTLSEIRWKSQVTILPSGWLLPWNPCHTVPTPGNLEVWHTAANSETRPRLLLDIIAPSPFRPLVTLLLMLLLTQLLSSFGLINSDSPSAQRSRWRLRMFETDRS